MGATIGRIAIVDRGRVLEVTPSQSVADVRVEDSIAWWSAIAVLGGSFITLGALVGYSWVPVTAICGFVLFLVTAVLIGAGHHELATASCASAIIWTCAGVSVCLGTDSSSFATCLGFEAIGVVLVLVGALRWLRRRDLLGDPSSSRT